MIAAQRDTLSLRCCHTNLWIMQATLPNIISNIAVLQWKSWIFQPILLRFSDRVLITLFNHFWKRHGCDYSVNNFLTHFILSQWLAWWYCMRLQFQTPGHPSTVPQVQHTTVQHLSWPLWRRDEVYWSFMHIRKLQSCDNHNTYCSCHTITTTRSLTALGGTQCQSSAVDVVGKTQSVLAKSSEGSKVVAWRLETQLGHVVVHPQ